MVMIIGPRPKEEVSSPRQGLKITKNMITENKTHLLDIFKDILVAALELSTKKLLEVDVTCSELHRRP